MYRLEHTIYFQTQTNAKEHISCNVQTLKLVARCSSKVHSLTVEQDTTVNLHLFPSSVLKNTFTFSTRPFYWGDLGLNWKAKVHLCKNKHHTRASISFFCLHLTSLHHSKNTFSLPQLWVDASSPRLAESVYHLNPLSRCERTGFAKGEYFLLHSEPQLFFCLTIPISRLLCQQRSKQQRQSRNDGSWMLLFPTYSE